MALYVDVCFTDVISFLFLNLSDFSFFVFFYELNNISLHLNRLVYNAESLIHDVDSNIVEQFNGLVCKFNGGKRVNYASSQGYGDRCLLAIIQHNSGIYIYSALFFTKLVINFII